MAEPNTEQGPSRRPRRLIAAVRPEVPLKGSAKGHCGFSTARLTVGGELALTSLFVLIVEGTTAR